MSRKNILYIYDAFVKKLGDESKISLDKIIDYLNKKEYDFIALCHRDRPSHKEDEISLLLNCEREHNISCEK